jgi:hypothetical protein
MMQIEGSISQRHGSADPDPDPHQNVMDPQHFLSHGVKLHQIFEIRIPHLRSLCVSKCSKMFENILVISFMLQAFLDVFGLYHDIHSLDVSPHPLPS